MKGGTSNHVCLAFTHSNNAFIQVLSGWTQQASCSRNSALSGYNLPAIESSWWVICDSFSALLDLAEERSLRARLLSGPFLYLLHLTQQKWRFRSFLLSFSSLFIHPWEQSFVNVSHLYWSFTLLRDSNFWGYKCESGIILGP